MGYWLKTQEVKNEHSSLFSYYWHKVIDMDDKMFLVCVFFSIISFSFGYFFLVPTPRPFHALTVIFICHKINVPSVLIVFVSCTQSFWQQREHFGFFFKWSGSVWYPKKNAGECILFIIMIRMSYLNVYNLSEQWVSTIKRAVKSVFVGEKEFEAWLVYRDLVLTHVL